MEVIMDTNKKEQVEAAAKRWVSMLKVGEVFQDARNEAITRYTKSDVASVIAFTDAAGKELSLKDIKIDPRTRIIKSISPAVF